MNGLVGKKAPAFNMKAVTGNGEIFFNVNLDDYKGKWLVLFFYPQDFTFVCPTEITGFSDCYNKFKAVGAEILSVSTDSDYSHQAWIRNGLGKINFPMAADKTMSVSSEYGVLLENEGIALRGLFIIDNNQIVRYSVIHDLNVGRSMEETLRVLKALQTNGLCGANWSEGKNTIDNTTAEKEKFIPTAIKDRVKVYSLPDCVYCKTVKTFLLEHNIPFDDINLQTDKDGQAFMDNRGYTALPVTVVNGEEISGYYIDKIKEVLTK